MTQHILPGFQRNQLLVGFAGNVADISGVIPG